MATVQEYISLLNPVIDSIKDRYGVTSLSIFGSTARGDNRPDSDVDIIVDMPPRIFLISGLQDFLENLLRVPVDLIRRHPRLSPAFLAQISQDGIKVF